MKSPVSRLVRLCFAVLVCALALGQSQGAHAQGLTLQDLVDGAPLMSASGQLLFTGFEVTPAGDVDMDLTNYAVEPLPDGFRVIPAAGGLSVGSGEAGVLAIDYQMMPGPGLLVGETALSFVAAATGGGALARATQDYFADSKQEQELGETVVLVTGGGGSTTSSMFSLSPAVTGLYVLATVQVEVPQTGSAAIDSVDQEFVVPEPGSELLALTALLCLGALRRHRAV